MSLLDTSVLTRLRAPSVVRRIEEFDAAGLARTSMTDLEIGLSASNADEWDRLVVAVDPRKDCSAGLGSGGEPVAVHEFSFQR